MLRSFAMRGCGKVFDVRPISLPENRVAIRSVLFAYARPTMVNVLMHETTHGQHTDPKTDTPALAVSEDLVTNLVRLFKLLSDETRLRILYYLTQRERIARACVVRVVAREPAGSQPSSGAAADAHLIERRREGKHNYYGLRTQQNSRRSWICCSPPCPKEAAASGSKTTCCRTCPSRTAGLSAQGSGFGYLASFAVGSGRRLRLAIP